jgi:hypothetical protein
MNPKKSVIWDPKFNRYTPEPIVAQTNQYRHDGDRQIGTCRVEMSADHMITMSYGDDEHPLIANSGRWAPYVLIESEGERPDYPFQSGSAVANIGDPTAELMLFETDERTQWRMSRPPGGADPLGAYAMVRRLHDEGNSYVATCMNPHGIAHIHKWFDRVS